MKDVKTNAMRILDSMGISYDIVKYEVDEEKLDACHAAEAAGIPLEEVFKTIVMESSDKRLFVFVTPGEAEISLKKARTLTGAKSIDLLKTSELQKHTGYIRGGCSPIGMIRKYPTYIEETAFLFDKIYVSAGLRGMQIHISPEDLLRSCGAEAAGFI